jgi:hypothetical protein
MVGSWKQYVYILRRTYQSQLEKSMKIMRTGGIPEQDIGSGRNMRQGSIYVDRSGKRMIERETNEEWY